MKWQIIKGLYHITLSATGESKVFTDLTAGIRWAYTTKLALQVANEWEMKA